MTIQEALLSAFSTLQRAHISSVHLDAEVLLASVLRKPRSYLLAEQSRKLTATQLSRFRACIRKRAQGMPVAYLTGSKEFYGLDFFVTKHVLIPRPDTESLIDVVIAQTPRDTDIRIADIGTGSGCIAVTLAKYLPSAIITAVDISRPALGVARKNARRHEVLSHIRFMQSNLLASFGQERFDMIIANLPYLTPSQVARVPFEPRKALDGGRLGLELIDRLLEQAPRHLSELGKVVLEIDPGQTKSLSFCVDQQMPGKKISFHKDLSQKDRIAIIS
ncbi:MAG: peptide chain release factor N(5)-glutamine methyltransferase [Patescibacteria group bacterium]|jgi:release factor glutamine methyltransferase